MKARIYHIDDVDRDEEVANEFTQLRQETVNEVEALQTQINEIRDLVTKKKKTKEKKKGKGGFVKSKMLLFIACIAVLIMAAILPVYAQYTPSDIQYDIVSNPELLTQLLRDCFDNYQGTSVLLDPQTSAPTATEGRIYYNDTADAIYLRTASAWVALDTATGVTLDGAYDQGGVGVGRTINATDGAVALSNTDADTAFLLTLNAAPGSSAALGGIEITVGANSTENGIEFENSGTGDDVQGTGDTWAVTKGGVADFVTVTLTGADSTGTLLTAAGIDTTGNSDTIVVTHSGSGDALQITANEADSVATRFIAAASQTTSLSVFDASTNNWDGADNVGMVHIMADDPLVHNGASLLAIVNSGQPKDGAEGFAMRIVDTGTARTTAYAMEIETTNTTPALKLNNQLTISGADSAGVLFDLTGINTTGNTDTMQIAHSGTGDALQITCTEADSVALNILSAANQTTSTTKFDGATGNWIGANDVGMVHISGDTAGAHAGASLVQIVNSAQPISAAEGFLLRLVDTGTARTNAYAMEIETTNTTPCLYLNNQLTISGADSGGVLFDITGIDTTGNSDTMTIAHSGTGDALQITCSEADSVALNCVAAASQTTSLAKFDAATNNWDGADNVGMVHISADDPLVHTGASLLQVVQTGQPIAASEGHLARFVSSGTARTDSYAVEIETTNTMPCLKLNNQLTISGADSAGVLFDITGIDTTGNTDTMTIAHSGTGDALQITCSEADSVGLNLVACASQTTSLAKIDAATNNWSGADNIGMLHISGDSALAHAGASLLQVRNDTGQPITGAEGFLARFVDTGTARTNAYAVEIEVTATTGGLYSSGHATFEKGCQVLSQGVTATADGLTTGLIPDHASFVTVTSDSADKVVVLPTWVIGHEICIVVPATGVEVETLATSNDTINGVDCDGANQLALVAGGVYTFKCVADSTWIAYGWASNGAAVATLTPDAD